jgi:CysZ protein
VAEAQAQRFDNPTARPLMSRVATGFSFAMSGIGMTLKDGKLRTLSVICVAINAVIYLGLLWAGWSMLVAFMGDADVDPAKYEGFTHSVVNLLEPVLEFMLGAVRVLLLVLWTLVAVFLALMLGNVVAGPVFDLMSERTEELMVGRAVGDPFTLAGSIKTAIGELFVQLGLLLFYLPAVLLIFLIGLIPLLGQILGPALGWSLASLWVTLGFTSQTAARHRLGTAQRLRFLSEHKMLNMGFGAVGGIPFLSFLLLPLLSPALVVGGTRMFLALAAWDRVPSRLNDADKAVLRSESAQLAS